MDPKIIAGIGVPILGLIGAFLYKAGKQAASGAISENLRQLHDDLEKAHSTPDPDDDKAVEEKIRATERLKAALDNLPA